MLCPDQPTRPGLARGCNKVASSFLADACVAREGARSLCRILNQNEVGELVHDNLRFGLKDRCRQRFCVEKVHHGRARAELPKEHCNCPATVSFPRQNGRGPGEAA